MADFSALFSANPEIRAYVRWSEEDGKVFVESKQDVEPIIKAAHERADWVPDKDMRHVAYIPEEIVAQATREGWNNDQAAWRRWANASENKCFRTWPGRI